MLCVCLLQSLYDRSCVFHSLLYLLGLALNVFLLKVFPIAHLIDVGNMIFGEQQLSRVFKDKLAIFIVEPEDGNIWVFMILNHKHLHHSLWSFSEPDLLLLNDLLIAHLTLILLLFSFELLLVVVNNLILFGHLFRDSLLSIDFLLLLRVLFVSYRVKILETSKFTIGDKTSWVVVSHTYCIWTQHVTHPKFWILLMVNHPYKWTVLVSLV